MPPPSDAQHRDPPDGRVRLAAIVLVFFGIFAWVGIPLGLASAIAGGEAGSLTDPLVAAIFFGFAATGTGLVIISRALRAGLPWARWAAIASLMAVSAAAVAMGAIAILVPGEGDGAGFILLGAIELLAVALVGLFSLLRSEDPRRRATSGP